ncbi:hypothetical protein IWW57_004523 [Coemansia sp. S610]|nr:hypothetical protein IWW57_004523 [Coemansia sp. S610]
MSNDNISNNSGNQTEQSFEALLHSASHNQAPQGYNVVHLVPETEHEARMAEWSALLIGKTLVDDNLAPLRAPSNNAMDDGENKAEAGDNKAGGAELPKAGDVAKEGDGIVGGFAPNTTGAGAGENLVVDSAGKSPKTEGNGDDDKAKAKKEGESRFYLASSLPNPHRILKGPNAMMTMDYHPERLNVMLDVDGVCTGVSFC